MSEWEQTALRELVTERLNLRWSEWARDHPHLAQVIDRTRLIESAVGRLAHDAEFRRAMREADLDEARLAAAARALAQADRVVQRLLPW